MWYISRDRHDQILTKHFPVLSSPNINSNRTLLEKSKRYFRADERKIKVEIFNLKMGRPSS